MIRLRFAFLILTAASILIAGCSNRQEDGTVANVEKGPAEAVVNISEAEAAALASTRTYLAAGGDPNAVEDGLGNTPLHNAARSGYPSVVKLLLEYGANVDIHDPDVGTPLCVTRNREVARILLDAGADVNAAYRWGNTVLHAAAANGTGYDAEFLALLLRHGAKPDKHGLDGYTPLHWAARCGFEKKAKMLLDAGAPIDALDEDGDTPLHNAIACQHFDVAKLLVARGAKLDLRSACGLGDMAFLRQKLQTADVNKKHNGGAERTLLHYAASGGQVKAAELLIDRGAKVDARTSSEWTPLHLAACNGHLDVVGLLLNRGAKVNAKDDSDGTPLHCAAAGCKPDVARLLIDRGADIEARTEGEERTPLSYAAEEGYISVVKVLLDKGADVNSVDDVGRTPMDWASLELSGAIMWLPRGPRDFPETMRELKRHGARNPPDKQPLRMGK